MKPVWKQIKEYQRWKIFLFNCLSTKTTCLTLDGYLNFYLKIFIRYNG